MLPAVESITAIASKPPTPDVELCPGCGQLRQFVGVVVLRGVFDLCSDPFHGVGTAVAPCYTKDAA